MNFLKIVKKMGLRKVIRSVLYRIFAPINIVIYKICLIFPIDDHLVVLESEGDLADNAYALYHYMKTSGIVDKYKVVWLVENKREARKRENAVFVVKNPFWVDAKRSFYLATCKWYIYDHGNVLPLDYHREGQKVVYLCHGYTGFKRPKGSLIDPSALNIDEIITTGDIPKQGVMDYYGIEEEKVKILGYSRLDWFTSDLNPVKTLFFEKYHFFE